VLEASLYYHEYLLFDTNQVLPMYLVQFEYDPEEDDRRKIPRCEVCEKNPSAVYCKSDNARLCESCDQQVHGANKLVSRHIRVPITDVIISCKSSNKLQQPQSFGNCPHHPHLGVEFFCPVCQIPVCVHCKMIGTVSELFNLQY
jgi:hypothetical protein